MLLASAGCATVSFEPVATPTRHAGRSAETVEIHYDSKPSRPFVNIAAMTSTFTTKLLREEAVVRGLDGVHTVRCGAPFSGVKGICHGIGFLYSAPQPFR
jgi:hypothetical protein